MKGVRSSMWLLAVVAVVAVTTITTQLISDNNSDFIIDTSKGDVVDFSGDNDTEGYYAIYDDFEQYLIDKADELNASKREGVPDVVLKASPYSSCVNKYPDGSRKGVFLAKVQVSYNGKAPNIREHKRALKALGTTGIHYDKVPKKKSDGTTTTRNSRNATSATATHVFFADYEDGHWIIFPNTRGLLERGVPMDVRFEQQRNATGLLEGYIKSIGGNEGL